MKIVAFEAENIKYLRVVNIKPDGSLVVIGGDNSEGKSCVLDSIEYALNGASSVPSKPIRAGQKKARIVLDLGDIQITRTFTKKGTNLVVKNKDGATFSSPQSMLSELLGELAFDPLEFSRMDAKKQAEVLKQLVGLDFDKANIQYKKLFDQRTGVNRSGKEMKANLDSMTKHEDVPNKEVSISELSEQYANAVENNKQLEHEEKILSDELTKLKSLELQIATLDKSIKLRKKVIKGIRKIDVENIRLSMTEAESINLKVRQNQEYGLIDYKLNELRKQSKSLTTQITKIEDDKAKTLAKAKFPIEGLAIDDDEGVTFGDIPLTQCSSAQQIRISVAIGLAMNPKLRVLLIREGSLLDEKNLAMIAKMAEDADAQIWLERVSKGKECSVILKDGSIKEPETVSV